jgi:hypothetical protein
VVPPDVRVTDEQLGTIKNWIVDNAERFWVGEDGPLRAPADGGADVIIIDDPQVARSPSFDVELVADIE